jgi:hypothetical protein
MKLKIDTRIFEKFPGLKIGAVIAIKNRSCHCQKH